MLCRSAVAKASSSKKQSVRHRGADTCRRENVRTVSAEMWKFVAVVIFFAVVLIAAYWFVLLPDR